VLAVVLTMIAGGHDVRPAGQDPVEAIRTIFWDPLFGQFASLFAPAAAGQGGAADPDRGGAALGFRAGSGTSGPKGNTSSARICGAAVGLAFFRRRVADLSADGGGGGAGRLAWAMIPAILKTGSTPTRSSCRCCWSMWRRRCWSMALGLLRNPEGGNFPRQPQPRAVSGGVQPRTDRRHGHALGRGRGLHRGDRGLCPAAAPYPGLPDQAGRAGPARGALCRGAPARLVLLCLGLSGALAGMAGMFEVTGPIGQISIDLPRLRVHRDHRGLSRAG
jgi:general nucleoside transport system permease protein